MKRLDKKLLIESVVLKALKNPTVIKSIVGKTERQTQEIVKAWVRGYLSSCYEALS